MDKDKTLIVIDETIDKWEKIVFMNGIDDGTDNCPLCVEFFHSESDICLHCPINTFQSLIGGCGNTPWIDWYNSHRDSPRTCRYPMIARNQKEINLANHELSFLYEVRLWWINKVNKEVA